MNVNINPDSPGSVTALYGTQEIQANKIAPPGKQSAQPAQDYATITSVGDLVTAALNHPEVRADKVSAIREAIASGTYEIDPHAIASSMLANHL